MLASHDGMTAAASPRRPTIEDLQEQQNEAGRKASMAFARGGRSREYLDAMAELDALTDQIREMRNPQPPLPGLNDREVQFLIGMCGSWR